MAVNKEKEVQSNEQVITTNIFLIIYKITKHTVLRNGGYSLRGSVNLSISLLPSPYVFYFRKRKSKGR